MERQELLNEVKKKNNDKVIQEKMCKTFSMRRLEVVSGTQAAEDFTERWPALLCANGVENCELMKRSAATRKIDGRILAIVSRDLVAAEGHYHRSCYRLYTKDNVPKNTLVCDEHDDADSQYEATVKQSFDELFQFIRVELFANPKVMFMTDLTSRLVASMNSKGIIQVKGSTKKHIRRKLEREFGGALHIFPDDNGKLLLYPDNLSLRKLVKENHNLKNIVNIVPS
ncbi:hypothetical protein N1851_031143 [Merluccius polli]|uniref:Uncharacterized protein n=1 Tax=Merluccius polli TaxID=89951 RepID=A0AA47M4A0_MERPO|nr:hypothetical protein N1851_031143 [Merluccius polli]